MRLEVWISLLVLFAALAVIVGLIVRLLLVRQRTYNRLFAESVEVDDEIEQERGWLGHWLYVAGFRGPNSVATFVILTLLCALAGLVLMLMVRATGALTKVTHLLSSIPGGVGEVFLPLVYMAPWCILLMMAALPVLMVRAARRKRVRQVERDLPIVLELLATLAEAGLGLDAAIERVLQSLAPRRVLAVELRAFQRDNLAGRPRVDSLRWFGRRVSMAWFSIFISAVVQSEQIGAGLAEVLKIQAADLRQRRKEQALAAASSTPIKLLVPLIVCFMPGVFVAALGPTFYEVFQMLDSLTRPLRSR